MIQELRIYSGSRLCGYGSIVSTNKEIVDYIELSCAGRDDIEIRIDHADLVQLVRDLVEYNLVKVKTVFE